MIKNRSKIIILIIICFFCLLTGIAWTVLPSISNDLMSKNNFNVLSISEREYSILTFSLVFAGILYSGFAGFFCKLKGLKTIMLSGLLFSAIGMILYAAGYLFYKNGYTFLLTGQFILGLGITSILTSLTSYLFLLLPNVTSIALTGIFGCINIGSFICPILFNLINHDKWGLNCIIIGGIELAMFFIALKILPSLVNPYVEKEPKKNFFLKKGSYLFWCFFTIIILYSICELIFSSWGIVFLNKEKKVNEALAKYSLSMYWIAVMIGELFTCWLLKYINIKYFYRLLPILLLLGFWGMFFSNKIIYIILFFIVGGLGSSAFVALSMNYVEHEFKKVAEIASGIMFMGYFSGYVIGALLIARLINVINLSNIFLSAGFICLAIEALVFFVISKSLITNNAD